MLLALLDRAAGRRHRVRVLVLAARRAARNFPAVRHRSSRSVLQRERVDSRLEHHGRFEVDRSRVTLWLGVVSDGEDLERDGPFALRDRLKGGLLLLFDGDGVVPASRLRAGIGVQVLDLGDGQGDLVSVELHGRLGSQRQDDVLPLSRLQVAHRRTERDAMVLPLVSFSFSEATVDLWELKPNPLLSVGNHAKDGLVRLPRERQVRNVNLVLRVARQILERQGLRVALALERDDLRIEWILLHLELDVARKVLRFLRSELHGETNRLLWLHLDPLSFAQARGGKVEGVLLVLLHHLEPELGGNHAGVLHHDRLLRHAAREDPWEQHRRESEWRPAGRELRSLHDDVWKGSLPTDVAREAPRHPVDSLVHHSLKGGQERSDGLWVERQSHVPVLVSRDVGLGWRKGDGRLRRGVPRLASLERVRHAARDLGRVRYLEVCHRDVHVIHVAVHGIKTSNHGPKVELPVRDRVVEGRCLVRALELERRKVID
mmetsp:Transcript_14551/g.41492  ORF Transcript_14551/g.41492 Transcript_14551/m.41492 type:complete len:489 (+) Transcript_14551:4111-5577(+)